MITMFQAEELALLACHTATTATLACTPDKGVHILKDELGISLEDTEEAEALSQMTQIACTLWFDDITSGGDVDSFTELWENTLSAWGAGVLDE